MPNELLDKYMEACELLERVWQQFGYAHGAPVMQDVRAFLGDESTSTVIRQATKTGATNA